MIGKANHVLCATFQAHLPDLIGSGADLASNVHLQNCANCRALIADLETIAEAAREFFPPVDPSEILWEHIESAIEHERAVHGAR